MGTEISGTGMTAGMATSEFKYARYASGLAYLAPVAAMVARSRGYDISAQDILTLITQSSTLVAGIWSVYGVARGLAKKKA